MRAFVQVGDPCFGRERPGHDLDGQGAVFGVFGVTVVVGLRFPVSFVEFQVVVAGDEEFQLRIDASKHLQGLLERGDATAMRQIATVEEYVGFGCGQLQGM